MLSYFLLALLLKLLQRENLTSYWKLLKSGRLKWQLLICPWLEFSLILLCSDDYVLFIVDLQHEIHMLNHLQDILYCNFGSAEFLCWYISYFNVKYWIKLFLSILLSCIPFSGNINICINTNINTNVWNMLSDVA